MSSPRIAFISPLKPNRWQDWLIRTLIFFCSLFLGAEIVNATGCPSQICHAASPSRTDVNCAVHGGTGCTVDGILNFTGAINGDTIVVPAGTASWTTSLNATGKAITLQGAGAGQTIINDNTTVSHFPLIQIIQTTGGNVRITGFTFQAGNMHTVDTAGSIRIGGAALFRIDHCAFYHLRNKAIYVACPKGVIDHNQFTFLSAAGIQFSRQTTTDFYGNIPWSQPLGFGSDDFVFLEDNVVHNDGGSGADEILTDGERGCKFVVRYNEIYDTAIGCHGTGTGGTRGGRAYEIYNNNFYNTRLANWPQPIGLFRSGTGVIWGNTVTNSSRTFSYRYFAQIAADRDAGYFPPWGGADGTSAWDRNDTSDQTGDGYGGGVGGLYASGTHGGSSGSLTLVVPVGSPGNPAPGWAADQWRHYAVRNVTTNNFSTCTTNTVDTITLLASFHSSAPTFTWNPGDQFEIRKVIQHFDGAVGIGGLLTDISATSTPVWLNQTIEPWYLWNNTFNGSSDLAVMAAGNGYNYLPGRDYINNGSTPKPGYTPFIYPHPLVSGILVPPANLRVTGP